MPAKHQKRKTIAFLATGSEFLTGDLLESNSHHSIQLIQNAGGNVRAIIITSDELQEIQSQLAHLLELYDAVITIGGLGPTSDDNTRFAVAGALDLPLELDEASKTHITERLNRFGLKLTDANINQAKFPKHATIIPNTLGTANACHILWQEHDIFMLPGPPKEYFPIFEQAVMPQLESNGYFTQFKTYHYVTLGLIEGVVSEQVDVIAAKYNLSSAFRWHYPYLDIKLFSYEEHDSKKIIDELDALLENHIVSCHGISPEKQLMESMSAFNQSILVETSLEIQAMLISLNLPKIQFVESDTAKNDFNDPWCLKFDAIYPSESNEAVKQVVQLSVSGVKNFSEMIYQHQLVVPKREMDLCKCIQCYFTWQVERFLAVIQKKNL